MDLRSSGASRLAAPPDLPLAEQVVRLRAACGLVSLPPLGLLEVSGADRLRFVNGFLTCDVKGLVPGASAFGFFTAREGRVLAEADVVAREDRLSLGIAAGRGAAMCGHLAHYLLADQVTLVLLGELPRLALVGPEAGARLAARGLPAREAGYWSAAEGESTIVRRDLGRLPAFEIWAPPHRLAELAATFRPEAVDLAAWQIARVEEGAGLWGTDYGEEHFPQETGRESSAVSYTKGCYLGQEVVARIHYRGGVQRALVGLRFAGEPPAAGTPLRHDGREAGRVGSAVLSPRWGAIGLAVVHQRAAAPGTALDLDEGARATVAALPFS